MFQKNGFPTVSKKVRRKKIFLLLTLSFLLASSQFGYGQNPPAIFPIEPRTPIERAISGGQKHEFKIAVSAGQYAKLTVIQNGVDVVIKAIDGGGNGLISFDAEPRIKGEETIEIYSAETGDFRLSVEPKLKSAASGLYQIELLERRDATAKEIALDEARKLLTGANNLWIAGKYSEALPFAEKAIVIRERELNAEHADLGNAYFVYGNIIGDIGDLEKCEEYYGRALAIWEKALGREHPSLGKVFLNWGVVYYVKGDYVKAENYYLRALAIWEKTLEPNNPSVASLLNNLGNLTSIKGDKEKAAEYHRRALTIRENALGKDSPAVALSLNNLANLYDDLAVAEPLYLRSLAIREKTLGLEHQDLAQSLYNLAVLYAAAGDYQKAQTMDERAIKIYEKTLGPETFVISYPINLLAAIYHQSTTDYDKAESLYIRAIAVKEKTQGRFHPDLGGTYSNLASLYALKGETEKAVAARTRANEIIEYNISLNMTVGSEREKLEYVNTLKGMGYQSLTLEFKTAPKSNKATDLAATNVLQNKGRVLDAMSDSLGSLRRRFDKQDQALLDNLNGATTELVEFVLKGGENSSAGEYTQNLKTLEQRRDSIENQISRRSAEFYAPSKAVTLKAVQAAIPDAAALLEFTIYYPTSQKYFGFAVGKKDRRIFYENARYAVFVIGPKGEARGVDLGESATIDAAIEELRTALRDPQRGDIKKFARAVDEKVMKPIRALIGDAKHLLVSPDGALNLIPFEALVDEKENYLIENYEFSYLTSGRELLRMKTVRESKNDSIIIANPSFGETSRNERSNVRGKKRQSVTATRDLSDTYFAPLAGTTAEARSIQTLFPNTVLLTGAQASETALKQINAPRILHIASHGFFLENIDDPDAVSTGQKRDFAGNAETENPMLRSGIALAGANKRESGTKDDGILTALEASGLNLWGTKLVVLSACDTGIGDVKNGEGVYGLRRAFALAGTESLMMSLWAVSDYATRELMTNYYKNLKDGMGRGSALREVKIEMLKKKGREHPFYWAAFIQSGDWSNLDGKR